MLLARGARSQKSPLRPLLLPFTPLLISWAGKSSLPILSKAEIAEQPLNINSAALLNGLYLNELLVHCLYRNDPYTNLFDIYKKSLIALQNTSKISITLRLFEKQLLKELGYGLHLDREVNAEKVQAHEYYYFDYGIGLQKVIKHNFVTNNPKTMPSNIYLGQSLLALHNEEFTSQKELDDAEMILQTTLKQILGSKKLYSLNNL